MLRQKLYKLYILTLAQPLVLALIIIRWKRRRLRSNAKICGLPDTLGFRIRFYQAAASDLLRFFHGHYGSPIISRPRDAARIDRLKSGPSLFLTAHFHHWEHMGAWMTRQGIPLLSAARPMVNPLSQSLLVRLRKRMGMAVVFRDIPRRALRHVNQGGCFGLLWDQRVPIPDPGSEWTGSTDSDVKEMSLFGTAETRKRSVVAEYQSKGTLSTSGNETTLRTQERPSFRPSPRAQLFGRSLALDPLPHFLTRHTPLPVFFGVLLPGGRFRIFQIAGPRRDSGTSKTTDAYRHLGRRYHRLLECLIRAYPAYWYGLAHDRFQGSAMPE